MLSSPVLLCSADMEETRKQSAMLTSTEQYPVRWLQVLDQMSPGGARRFRPSRFWNKGILLGWHMHPSVLLAAVSGRELGFLAWGVGHFTGWRRAIVRGVLKRATFILVNDPQTAGEILHLTGRQSTMVPFPVDTEFFHPTERERGEYLFCPGSNDRDPDFLLDLVGLGHDVVWMNNDPELSRRYANVPGLTIVSRPSFVELRTLYQNAKACVLPLRRDAHAAGQTTSLEAIACGTPVLISAGRTADIFQPLGLVAALPDGQIQAWQEELARLPDAVELERRRSVVHDRHSPNAVKRSLSLALTSGERCSDPKKSL